MPVHNADKSIDSTTPSNPAKELSLPSFPSPSSPCSPLSPVMSASSVLLPSALPPTTRRKDAIIIFDWDDTLLSSSFLSSIQCRLDTDLLAHPLHAALHAQLAELDQCTSALLTAALHYSPHHVHVVTNAETGWVQLSAAKFLPLTFSLLTRCKIVSARSNYESSSPTAHLSGNTVPSNNKLVLRAVAAPTASPAQSSASGTAMWSERLCGLRRAV